MMEGCGRDYGRVGGNLNKVCTEALSQEETRMKLGAGKRPIQAEGTGRHKGKGLTH
jgi:hypothetical protein